MVAKLKANTDTGSDAVARARNVVELVKVAAPRIDAARELPPDVLEALHKQRLFRVLLPKSVGGDELDLVTFGEVIETLAAADASVGWVVSQGSGCAMGAAFLPTPSLKKFFGAADAVLAWGAGIQGKATIVDGGYRVSGKWTFASGSRHATVLGGHSYIFDKDGKPVMRPNGRQLDRTLLVPRAKCKVHDVWQVVGLKGTGSDTFEFDDLFVPHEDTVDRESIDELREKAAIFYIPGTHAYAVGFSSLMLGIARGQIDELRTVAMTKTPRGAPSSLRDSPTFHAQLAVLEAKYRSARIYVNKTAGDIYEEVGRTKQMTLAQKVDLKLATTYAINQGVEMALEAYRAAGQTAIFLSNPFERRMRDALTASQQTQGRPLNYITIGRVMMGLEPDSQVVL